MSALDDLRNLETSLDAAITGWIGYNWKPTTVLGGKCSEMVSAMRRRHYKAWGENCALRARLSRALDDNDGLRDGNASMTAQIEELESAAAHYKARGLL